MKKAVWNFSNADEEQYVGPVYETETAIRNRQIPEAFHGRSRRGSGRSRRMQPNVQAQGNKGQCKSSNESQSTTAGNQARARCNPKGNRTSTAKGRHFRSEQQQSRAVQHAVDYDFNPSTSRAQNRYEGEENRDKSYEKDTGAKEKKPIIFGFKKMKELVNRDSNEILLTLSMPNNGFAELLEKISSKRDLIAFTLIALGKACSSLHQKNIFSLLGMVTQSKMFMFVALQQYLVSFNTSKNEEYHLESLVRLAEFLNCYQKRLTASSSEILPVLLPLFKIASQSAFAHLPQRLEFIQAQICDLEKQQNDFISCHTSQIERTKAVRVELMNTQQPPEDFRSIPILPCAKDVFEHTPFLRPNVVKGKYIDAEHYLDVQFRLLREDYVRPLREGIAAYKRLKKLGQSMSRNKEVRIYQNIQIIKQDFFNGNLIHVAMFDVKAFSRVNWEHSKRFLSGSLVCLSSDDFNTMLFASVAFRDPKKLKEGILILQFDELSSETLNISPLQIFTMVETSAYFEAYCHNLTALHSLTVEAFPLKKYIVDVQKEVEYPAYLKANTTYDMEPLLKMSDSNGNSEATTDFDAISFALNAMNRHAKAVEILNDSKWLTPSELGLDPSQYKALKNAITKEFAIIQGPPGTGKTFVGLKIVQLLLHNSSEWNNIPDNKSPILIVCYTNHALDQFLEGIHCFTDGIVRIGGRCSNDTLARYQLRNLKKAVREKRNVPNHIFSNVKHQHFLLDQLRREIGRTRKDMEKSLDNLLSEEVLKPHMDSKHYHSLKSFLSKELDDGFVVMDWLSLRYRDFEDEEGRSDISSHDEGKTLTGKVAEAQNLTVELQNALMNQKHAANEMRKHNLVEEQEEEEEEFDTEFVEGMRDVDTEDYSGLSIMQDEINVVDTFILSEGWQVQGGIKKRKQYIMKQLARTLPLTEATVERIRNIWELHIDVRWQLYKYWLQKFIESKQTESLDLQLQVQNECAKLKELRTEEDFHLLQDAKIIGMTTTGAAKYRSIVLNAKPKIVVVEEAAEVLEAHIVTSLVQETQHLILIGDHQQLRPSPNVYDLATKFNLNISLFERMVDNGMPYCQLALQHRMRPAIAELLVPHIYPDLRNHESVFTYEDIKGTVKNMFFVSHNFMEGSEVDSTSKVNEHEAKFVVQLCKYLLLQGYDASQITILTTYTGQMSAIKKISKTDILRGVRITVVDNYQGEENDIVIISFVRSNDEGSIGFLKVSNRVCVALSRAKKGLFCIGNFNLLAGNSDLWKNILDTLTKQGAIGPALQLQCQKHKDVITEVAKEKDFAKVAEGGCTQPCNYRLECGHSCPKICHSYDHEHKYVKCQKPCLRILCGNDHRCTKKCFQACGPCNVLMKKVLPDCKHEVAVPCHIPPNKFKCTEPCTKTLLCGHTCQNPCGQPCDTLKCNEKVSRTLLCRHTLVVTCSDHFSASEHISLCTSPCQALLMCGHKCTGSCGKCHQGRLHVPCRKRCDRILVCGHKCKSPCSNVCPPCKMECENQCTHSKCEKKCGEPCNMCSEPCIRSCEHQTCGNLCGEQCDIKPCSYPCEKMLECGHMCIGLCGEPCPALCGKCNSQEVYETFFGMEKDPNAVFIQLEGCRHVFEVQGLTHWMTRESRGKIEMKSCPKCKTVIRNDYHFKNIIKSCLSDIEKVKTLIFGDIKENKARRLLLIQDLLKLKFYRSFQNLMLPIQKYVEHTEVLSSIQILRLENIIKIADIFLPLKDSLKARLSNSMLLNLSMSVSQTKDLISGFITNDYKTASEQRFYDVKQELLRLQLIDKFIKFVSNSLLTGQPEHALILKSHYVTGIVHCLKKLGRFEKADEDFFSANFAKLCAATNGTTSLETKKTLVLRSMDLSQGNWYYCFRGHVYCAKESVSQLLEHLCPKCEELTRVPHYESRSASDDSSSDYYDGSD